MNKLNKFSEFIKENYEVNRYQHHLTRLLNKIDIDLFYIEKYKLSIISFYPLIESLLNNEFDDDLSIQDILLIIVISVNILVYENKDKIQKLLNIAMEYGISEELIDYVVSIFNKIEILFTDISKRIGKGITKFVQVLSYTELLIPFLRILYLLYEENMIDIENINKENKLKYNTLLDKIIKKLIFMSNSTNKIKNIENLKPLFVNDELKVQGLKPEKKFRYDEGINESLKDKMKGKSKKYLIESILNSKHICKKDDFSDYIKESIEYFYNKMNINEDDMIILHDEFSDMDDLILHVENGLISDISKMKQIDNEVGDITFFYYYKDGIVFAADDSGELEILFFNKEKLEQKNI